MGSEGLAALLRISFSSQSGYGPAESISVCSRVRLNRAVRTAQRLASLRVDVLLACRQDRHPEVVQPWRRGCPPSRGLPGTCWSFSEKVRTSPFIAADNTATHRQSWRSHSAQNRRHLRVSDGSSTNTGSQPNSIPRGQPSLWRSLVTKGEQSCLWRIAISPMIPQDSRPGTILRSAIFSSFSSAFICRSFIYRSLSDRTGRNCGIRAFVGLNGPKNDADAVELVIVNA